MNPGKDRLRRSNRCRVRPAHQRINFFILLLLHMYENPIIQEIRDGFDELFL